MSIFKLLGSGSCDLLWLEDEMALVFYFVAICLREGLFWGSCGFMWERTEG